MYLCKSRIVFLSKVKLVEVKIMLTLINTFMKTNDIAFLIEFRENREGDVPVVYCNADKAKQELGWVATKTLQDMCRDAYCFSEI